MVRFIRACSSLGHPSALHSSPFAHHPSALRPVIPRPFVPHHPSALRPSSFVPSSLGPSSLDPFIPFLGRSSLGLCPGNLYNLCLPQFLLAQLVQLVLVLVSPRATCTTCA
jgi:hypothetical protein